MDLKISIYEEVKKAILDALYEFSKNNDFFLEKEPENGEGLLTVKQFCNKHPFISQNGLRKYIFNKDFNKFKTCISKVGRRVLIKETEALDFFSNPPPEANWIYDKSREAKSWK